MTDSIRSDQKSVRHVVGKTPPPPGGRSETIAFSDLRPGDRVRIRGDEWHILTPEDLEHPFPFELSMRIKIADWQPRESVGVPRSAP